MAEDKKTLADLKDAVEEKEKTAKTDDKKAADTKADAKDAKKDTAATDDNVVEVPQPVLDAKGRAYATGRRKNAVARVWVYPGNGKITVNGRDQEIFFARATQRLLINQPFEVTNREGQFDVLCTVSGGGLSGQAGAVRHGIARALTNFEPELRGALKSAGLLTRDSRMVERKKYGRRKARRGMQWAKR